MSSPRSLAALAAFAALASLGCGDSRLKVAGTVNLTLQQLGQPDGSTGFTFPADTIVGENPTGYCRVNGGRVEVRLERVGGSADGLRAVQFTLPPVGAIGTEAPTVNFVVGTSSFDGGSSCTRTSTVTSDGDLRNVTATLECTGLRAAGDARTVAAQVRLELTNCTAQ